MRIKKYYILAYVYPRTLHLLLSFIKFAQAYIIITLIKVTLNVWYLYEVQRHACTGLNAVVRCRHMADMNDHQTALTPRLRSTTCDSRTRETTSVELRTHREHNRQLSDLTFKVQYYSFLIFHFSVFFLY